MTFLLNLRTFDDIVKVIYTNKPNKIEQNLTIMKFHPIRYLE